MATRRAVTADLDALDLDAIRPHGFLSPGAWLAAPGSPGAVRHEPAVVLEPNARERPADITARIGTMTATMVAVPIADTTQMRRLVEFVV